MEWQDIETAPRDGTRVLVWSEHWYAPSTASFYGDVWKIVYELPRFYHQPTHWMPLPTPPKPKP